MSSAEDSSIRNISHVPGESSNETFANAFFHFLKKRKKLAICLAFLVGILITITSPGAVDIIDIDITASSLHNAFPSPLPDPAGLRLRSTQEILEKNFLSNERSNIINTTQTENDSSGSYAYEPLYNLDYEFISNISIFPYSGKWTNISMEEKFFDNDSGNLELEIIKNNTSPNYISNIESIDAFYISFLLKDGDYRDKFFVGNISLSLPVNFSSFLNLSLSSASKISISNANVTMQYVFGEIFGDTNRSSCNATEVTIEFAIGSKVYRKGYTDMVISSYPKLSIHIRDTSCKFSVDMEAEIQVGNDLPSRVWNYSIILTAISLVQIYFTIKLLLEINENNQIGLNLDLISLSIGIVWNAFICTTHFYLSITNEDFSYEYGTPSMTYFLLFSVFELRLLFFSWRARYLDLVFTDMAGFRKKLLKFYSLFYVCLFISLLSMRFIFSNFWTCYLFFLFTWLFQIIHSARTGTKPSMSLLHILVLSFGKLFVPLYIKACPYNVFELSPAYGKMTAITLTVVIEMIILSLQKLIGPKFLIPACWKKMPYNYYRDLENEDLKKLNNDCVICLDSLQKTAENSAPDTCDSLHIDEPLDSARNLQPHIGGISKITSKFTQCIESLKHTYPRKKFIVTPCNHAFHSSCMEKWMEWKNECPYCRRQIPPLDI